MNKLLVVLMFLFILGCGKGPAGETGPQGIAGPPGEDGQDGESCVVFTPKKNIVTIQCPGTTLTFRAPTVD